MTRDRRSVIRAGLGLLAGTALAGCSGGSSGNNSSNGSNDSSGNSSSNSSTQGAANPATSSGTAVGTAGSGGTTTAQAQILPSEPEWESDGTLSLTLSGDSEVDKVRLMSPKGEFGVYQPDSYETRASFQLIKQSSKQFSYKKYPYGTYHAVALRGGQPVDRQAYQLRPRFVVSEVQSSNPAITISFENAGTAPAPITAARIYSSEMSPGPNQFGGGFVDQDAIVTPGDTIRVETRLMGFDSQMPIKGNKSALDYSDTYCKGNVHSITIDRRVFGTTKSTSGSLAFTGDPTEGPNGNSAVCSEYTLNLDGGGGTSTTTGGATGGGLRTITVTTEPATTSGNLTTASGSSTSSTTN